MNHVYVGQDSMGGKLPYCMGLEIIRIQKRIICTITFVYYALPVWS